MPLIDTFVKLSTLRKMLILQIEWQILFIGFEVLEFSNTLQKAIDTQAKRFKFPKI